MQLTDSIIASENDERVQAMQIYIPLVRKNAGDKDSVATLKSVMGKLRKSASDVCSDAQSLVSTEALLAQIKSFKGLYGKVTKADDAIPAFEQQTQKLISDHEELLFQRSQQLKQLTANRQALHDQHSAAHATIKQYNALLSSQPELMIDYKPAMLADVD